MAGQEYGTPPVGEEDLPVAMTGGEEEGFFLEVDEEYTYADDIDEVNELN